MANRLMQDDSDARLEAMFADGPDEEEDGLPDSIGQVYSWEDGAAEIANMIGAEVCIYTSVSVAQQQAHCCALFMLDTVGLSSIIVCRCCVDHVNSRMIIQGVLLVRRCNRRFGTT